MKFTLYGMVFLKLSHFVLFSVSLVTSQFYLAYPPASRRAVGRRSPNKPGTRDRVHRAVNRSTLEIP